MRDKPSKGYWVKRHERFDDGATAKSRAGQLRTHTHVAHVTVEKEREEYVVRYSVAKWYVEELKDAGGTL